MIKTNKKLYILAFTLIFGIMLFPVAKSLASDITISNIISLVNKARNIQGVESLSESAKLDKVAADKLQDMVENKYFAHTSPEGKNPWYWFGKNKYNYEYAGENLAIDFMTAEKQHEAWMKSETHKKNILNPNFTEIGVAVGTGEIDGHISIIAVQAFGTPAFSEATANKKENFSNAQKATPSKQGTVLAAKELKLEKPDSAIYGENNPTVKENMDTFKKDNSQLVNSAWLASWIILILALAANPLIILVAIFRIKSGANKLAEKVRANADDNFIDQRQFR